MNPEKHTSNRFILMTVLSESLDGADMLNLALCLSSVSAPGMYLTNPYQTGVCISPTKILHQAASPSAVYVSHQAEYCTKHQALPTHPWYVSHKHYQPHPQRLSHPAKTNTIRGVCLEQVCSDRVKRRKMCCQDLAYLSVRIPLLHYVPEGCALSIIKSAQSFFGITLYKGPRSAI